MIINFMYKYASVLNDLLKISCTVDQLFIKKYMKFINDNLVTSDCKVASFVSFYILYNYCDMKFVDVFVEIDDNEKMFYTRFLDMMKLAKKWFINEDDYDELSVYDAILNTPLVKDYTVLEYYHLKKKCNANDDGLLKYYKMYRKKYYNDDVFFGFDNSSLTERLVFVLASTFLTLTHHCSLKNARLVRRAMKPELIKHGISPLDLYNKMEILHSFYVEEYCNYDLIIDI